MNQLNPHYENLKVLAVFHYVMGGLGMFFSLIPLIYVFVGGMFLAAPEFAGELASDPEVPEGLFTGIGAFFTGFGLILFFFGEAFAILTIVSGVKMAKCKGYTLSFVLACIHCIFFPFGTILGIFTIVTLSKDGVKALYNQNQSQASA